MTTVRFSREIWGGVRSAQRDFALFFTTFGRAMSEILTFEESIVAAELWWSRSNGGGGLASHILHRVPTYRPRDKAHECGTPQIGRSVAESKSPVCTSCRLDVTSFGLARGIKMSYSTMLLPAYRPLLPWKRRFAARAVRTLVSA